MLQHGWAEIHHDLGYKTAAEIPFPFRRRFARLAGVLELADSEFDAIRAGLESYASSVSEEIHKDPSTVQIDKDSLMAYVGQDDSVKRVDSKLAAIAKRDLVPEPDQANMERLVRWLKYLAFETIQDVATALEDTERLISDQLGRQQDVHGLGGTLPVYRGVSLFRLCLVLLAKRGGAKELEEGFEALGYPSSEHTVRYVVETMPPGTVPPSSS